MKTKSISNCWNKSFADKFNSFENRKKDTSKWQIVIFVYYIA